MNAFLKNLRILYIGLFFTIFVIFFKMAFKSSEVTGIRRVYQSVKFAITATGIWFGAMNSPMINQIQSIVVVYCNLKKYV